jgi:hypothetical protein
MGTIMTLYVAAFFYFSHMVSGVFAQAFIYKSSNFPTEFFKDNIYYTQISSV